MKDLAAPPVSPVVWEAALGRRVVLIEDRLWVNAREKARAMLGGEPEYVQTILPGSDIRELFAWDWVAHPKRRANYLRLYYYRNGNSLSGVALDFPG